MSYVRVVVLTFLTLVVASLTEAATAVWDRNPESNIAGYRFSYGTQSGVHTVTIDVGNVTTYQFFPPAGFRYYVVVQAYNTSGVVGPKSDEVIYDTTGGGTQNQAPTLQQPANQLSVRNSAVSLTLVGSDPEGNALYYNASGLPPGLSVNATTGVIAGTVTTAGTYSVNAAVTDGSLSATRTFTWQVTTGTSTTVNLSPVATTISMEGHNFASTGRLYTTTYPENRPYSAIVLKFDLSQIPSTAVIESASLQMTLARSDSVTSDPNEVYTISLHQIINHNADPTRATATTYDGTNQWTAPMAQSDITPARAVLAVNRVLGVKSWDAATVVRAWLTTPSSNYGLLLNPDLSRPRGTYRSFSNMTAPTNDRPVLRVTYSTSGGGGGDTTAPTISLTAPASNATVSGASVTASATASDNVGVAGVQFRLNGANLGAEDTIAPYSIVWNTTTATNGTHVLTAIARDAAGNTATSIARTVTVSNQAANRAPTLTQPANQTSAEGSAVSLSLQASDPDNNPLTYSATGLPSGLSVNATTGVISGTPGFTSAGPYTVTATVSDGSLSQSRTFTWTVTNTNRAPTLVRPANQVSASGAAVSLQLSASDPDGTALTYSATGLPPGLTINASTGLISGTPGTAGVYNVVATVSDGQTTALQSFTWSIDSPDVPVRGDFDGDGRNDLATYRPATREWRVWLSGSAFAMASPFVFGQVGDIPVPADYDGDRRTDFAVYRPSNGTWYALLSTTNNQSQLQAQWGDANDRPMPIDYDNDGRADLALPRFGGFVILLSGSNYTTSVTVQ